MKITNKTIAYAGIIAALYVVLTFLSSLAGLSSGLFQVRISEALVALCFYSPATVIGITIGCFLSGLLTGAVALDLVFGTLATLLGALGAYYIGKLAKAKGSKVLKYLVPLPNVLANSIILPFVFRYGYGIEGSLLFFGAVLLGGELISSQLLGIFLLRNKSLPKLFEQLQ